MKIRVERDVLAEAVAWAARSLPARPPAPVLAGLLLKAEGGQLSLSSFDYEVSARVSVEAEVDEEGTVLVSGRLLADICRALPNRPVEISTDGVRATVVCGSSRFTLHTLPVEEYPALPQMPNATGTVPGEVFASAASQVAIAAGRDDTLPVLTGVRIEIEGDTVTLASTDRYRFAVREFLWKPENPDASAVALVPAKTLLDTAKALTSGDQVILALSGSGSGEGLIGFEGAGRRTTTRLLEGDLPKYRSLFPTEFNSVAVIETAPFVEAVKRVALVAERNTPVRLSFEQGVLILEAGSSDDAQAVDHHVHQAGAAQRPPGDGRGGGRGLQVPDHAGAAQRLIHGGGEAAGGDGRVSAYAHRCARASGFRLGRRYDKCRHVPSQP